MSALLKKYTGKALFAVAIVLSSALFGYSQQSPDVRLPAPFSGFSKNDVFAAVFPDFDRSTGRIPHILNAQHQASLVRLDQARLWRSGRQSYLVAMMNIGEYGEYFERSGLCGNCAAASPIVVLRTVNGHLKLVAKQNDDFYLSRNGEDHSTAYDAFSYAGHDNEISFDLAPYRLNSEELLIGVRYQHMWIPATSFSTTVILYRVEGSRIRKVFENLVVDRSWTNGPAQRFKMEKTNSILKLIRTKGLYNRLVTVKKTRKCIANLDTYDCTGGTPIKTISETWEFDGERFVETEK
jgi:hypothetical protein